MTTAYICRAPRLSVRACVRVHCVGAPCALRHSHPVVVCVDSVRRHGRPLARDSHPGGPFGRKARSAGLARPGPHLRVYLEQPGGLKRCGRCDPGIAVCIIRAIELPWLASRCKLLGGGNQVVRAPTHIQDTQTRQETSITVHAHMNYKTGKWKDRERL